MGSDIAISPLPFVTLINPESLQHLLMLFLELRRKSSLSAHMSTQKKNMEEKI